jgi:choline dehydrogenase-like flavoprotein
MFLDAREIPEGAKLDCDLCIVGAGAAGITIARELGGSGLEVCVLESGGLESDARTQVLYEGEEVGQRYSLTASRLRFFGGTTNHWLGWCRPLEEIDFVDRAGVPDSAWPIGRAELEPYYRRAQRICELGPFRYDTGYWADRTATTPFRLGPDVENRVIQFSPPTRFGAVYRDDLKRARGVRVLLHANLVRLELSPNGALVRRARAATLGGHRFSVAARSFVLATGAIENARLLLASDDVQPTGVGNGHDLVGRYFSDHFQAPVGSVALPTTHTASAFYDVRRQGPRPHGRAGLITSDELVRREGLLRFSAYFQPFAPPGRGIAPEVASVMRAVQGRDARRVRVLHMASEPAPDRDNRVTLTRAVDPLGVRRVRLSWRPTELDRRSARRSIEVIAGALGAAGVGRVQSQVLERGFWRNVAGSSHHTGTTRMHRDPRRGVVGADCRVHGVGNLYVAGSAVFPRAGLANPTLTIVALAVRLAEHLKQGAR